MLHSVYWIGHHQIIVQFKQKGNSTSYIYSLQLLANCFHICAHTRPQLDKTKCKGNKNCLFLTQFYHTVSISVTRKFYFRSEFFFCFYSILFSCKVQYNQQSTQYVYCKYGVHMGQGRSLWTSTGLYFGYGTENDELQCKTAFFIPKRTIWAGKSIEFVTDII